MKTTRRDWLKMFSAIGLVNSTSKAETPLTWTTHVCEAGTTVGENIFKAQLKAKREHKEVRFEFNYHTHYCVFPDGHFERQTDELA